MAPRKRSAKEIAAAKPKRRPAPERGAKGSKKSSSSRHPTVAEIVKRNQEIVTMRDVFFMTFTQIALKLGVSEKTAREGYGNYVREIAPLLVAEDAHEKAAEFIRRLESVQAAYAETIASTESESSRLRALSGIVAAMGREIELRQNLGLLPKEMGTLRIVGEIRWVAEQVVTLLQKYNVPPEALSELHSIMSGERSS